MSGLLLPLLAAGWLLLTLSLFFSTTVAGGCALLALLLWWVLLPGRTFRARCDRYLMADGSILAGGCPGMPAGHFWKKRAALPLAALLSTLLALPFSKFPDPGTSPDGTATQTAEAQRQLDLLRHRQRVEQQPAATPEKEPTTGQEVSSKAPPARVDGLDPQGENPKTVRADDHPLIWRERPWIRREPPALNFR